MTGKTIAMTMSGATTSGGVVGFGLIMSQINIYVALVYLIFFSTVNSTIRWKMARDRKDTDFNHKDFFIAFYIALGAGVVFMLMGILAGRDEMWIYIFGIVGSLSGLAGIDWIIDKFLK